MKIAYIAYFIGPESGVLKKIKEQIACWIAEGHDVRLFGISRHRRMWSGMREIKTDIIYGFSFADFLTVGRKVSLNVLEWKPDAVYFRYGVYLPYLETILKNIPTVIEINSDDIKECKLTFSKIQFCYLLFTRNRLLKFCNSILSVSEELIERFSHFNKPMMVIGNGINLNRFGFFPAPCNRFPRLLFSATKNYPWHGIDKIAELAKAFPCWHFDIVGMNSCEVEGEKPVNLHFHGYLGLEDYEYFMSKADVAIGTLALYRKKMNEASPLKVREYLAYGIPTIIGYKDTDLHKDVPFVLSLPNTPDNITNNLNNIKLFVEDSIGKRVPINALGCIDAKLKEKRRLNFITMSSIEYNGALKSLE